jgi:proteasome assembly chaperone (PAC2) family protein
LEKINFEFDSTKPATQQANDILKAVSDGDISPDAAKAVMDIVKMAIDIEVNTELKQRIEEIEKALGINA